MIVGLLNCCFLFQHRLKKQRKKKKKQLKRKQTKLSPIQKSIDDVMPATIEALANAARGRGCLPQRLQPIRNSVGGVGADDLHRMDELTRADDAEESSMVEEELVEEEVGVEAVD